MNKKLIVREKDNGEKGLFATTLIKEGEVVLEPNPDNKILSKEELETIVGSEKKYVALFDDKYILLAEPGRFVCHSCNPNIKNIENIDYAARDIEEGEEILGDYEQTGTLIGFPCSCGRDDCRKIVNGAEIK